MPNPTIICDICHLAHPPVDVTQPFLADTARELQLQTCVKAQATAMEWLLDHVGKKSTCDGPNCGATIFWVTHTNGKRTPYTTAGLNHFVDCVDRERFQRRRG